MKKLSMYLSLHTVNKIFKTSGLKVFDVEILQTHGGSLRVFGCHDSSSREINISVNNILDMEEKHGLRMLKTYEKFQTIVDGIKSNLLEFLSNLKEKNKTVIGYGAAAKGNTLLNYARINNDLIQFVCDAAKSKQGKYLPGSHIPIIKPDEMRKIKPDVVLILPWNIADEIAEAHSYIKEWGGEMYRAIPRIEIIK